MTIKAFKNLIFIGILLSITSCGLDSRLDGAWKNTTLGFTIDFNVKNKTMAIKTGVSDIKVKTTFDKIDESGDTVNLTTKDGDKTVVTFKSEDEIEVSTNDIPISLTFSRVKK
jgi:hypothetical protein